jgi:outer membrane protein OmpA-like peptidoglycan-associated protein
MQQTLGNQAVQRLARHARATPSLAPAAAAREDDALPRAAAGPLAAQRQAGAGGGTAEEAAAGPAATDLPEVPALRLLDPTVVRPALSRISLGLPPLTLAPPRGPAGGGPTTPGPHPPLFGPGSPPLPGPPAPLVAPGEEAEEPAAPRPADAGDLLDALIAVPAVDAAIDRLREQAAERIASAWGRLGTGGRIGVVSSLGVIGLTTLGGALANPDARRLLLDQLNGRVLPVPGLSWLSVELNTEGENLLFGLHADVGALLPASLGFGPSSPTAFGGPPGPEPSVPGQRTRAAGAPASPAADRSAALADEIHAAAGGGQPLDPPVRRQLEAGLGADLAPVRIHADSESDLLARSVDAVAFTAGRDIFFRAGAYAPGTAAGQHLLAHEAVHVMQQATGPVAGTPTTGGMTISDPSDAFEQEAERAAGAALGASAMPAEIAAPQGGSGDRHPAHTPSPGALPIMRYIERRVPEWGAPYVPNALDRSWVRLDPILVEVREGGTAPAVAHTFSHDDETTTVNVRAGSSGTIRVRVHVRYSIDNTPPNAHVHPGAEVVRRLAEERGEFDAAYDWPYSSTTDGRLTLEEGSQAPGGGHVGTVQLTSFGAESQGAATPGDAAYVLVQPAFAGPSRSAPGVSVGEGGSVSAPTHSTPNANLNFRFRANINLTGVVTPLVPQAVQKEAKTYDAAVHVRFRTGRDTPEPGEARRLHDWWEREVPDWVKAREAHAEIRVIGHASTLGTEDHNNDLSRRRAENLVNRYMGFIDRDASHLRYEGEFRADSPPETDDPSERMAEVRVSARDPGVATSR